MSHSGVNNRLKCSTQGSLVDIDPKTLDHTGFSESADPFSHGIGGEMDPVTEHLP